MKRGSLVVWVGVAIFGLVSLAAAQQATRPAAAEKTKAAAADKTSQPSPSKQLPPSSEVMDANDPLFGVPPLPKGPVSLVGGQVQKVDRVRNRVTVKAFGNGKKMTFAFDERTHIYRDGVETTERGIRRGDRAYVDGMLDGTRLFARNIRIVTSLKPSDAQGQVVSYDPGTGRMTVRDGLSAMPVSFRVTRQTKVTGGGGQGAIELVPGSLVTVRFSAAQRNGDVAREVTILAEPGNRFTFSGKVRHLDLRMGTLAVENVSDNKTYELGFEPGVVGSNVMVGSEVTISAIFTGGGYRARTVKVGTRSE